MGELQIGDRVRVLSECPHTLPAYARALEGRVESRTDEGTYAVRFGEDRVFPIAAEWLRRLDAA